MDADERDICNYLKNFPKEFLSSREICRRAGGKWRYRENEKWAYPVLIRLLEKGILERDSTGHYRLIQKKRKKEQERWISPQVKAILDQSGKIFLIEDESESEEKP